MEVKTVKDFKRGDIVVSSDGEEWAVYQTDDNVVYVNNTEDNKYVGFYPNELRHAELPKDPLGESATYYIRRWDNSGKFEPDFNSPQFALESKANFRAMEKSEWVSYIYAVFSDDSEEPNSIFFNGVRYKVQR